MTTDSIFKTGPQNGLQPVDLGRHLGGIATLMELCFDADMDANGRGLVREMQFLSHLGPLLGLFTVLSGGQQPWPWGLGFVWVEEGQVVGSVSTQRAVAQASTWLVANVAVHPHYRRRGIAWALMHATLDFIRSHGGRQIILQVDDDNPGAIDLYRRLGFSHTTTQTAWLRPAHTAAPPYRSSAFDIRLRRRDEWAEQLALATLIRPEGLAWNQPLRPEDFRPNWAKALDEFFSGQKEEHWVVEAHGRLVGSLLLRINWAEGDRMILLVHPDFRGQVERPLLERGLRRLASHAVRLEYFADDILASTTLRELNFQPTRTLRWMRLEMREGS